LPLPPSPFHSVASGVVVEAMDRIFRRPLCISPAVLWSGSDGRAFGNQFRPLILSCGSVPSSMGGLCFAHIRDQGLLGQAVFDWVPRASFIADLTAGSALQKLFGLVSPFDQELIVPCFTRVGRIKKPRGRGCASRWSDSFRRHR
jgi:hypothetical protein